MSQSLVTDALWNRIAPLLPPEPPKPKGGRPRVSDRAALNGILYVLGTGIQWKHLPTELGFGCRVTVWRREVAWQRAGVRERLHRLLVDELGDAGQLDWTRVVVDTRCVPAKKGRLYRANLIDRGKTGSKQHVVVDRHGIPSP